MSTAVDEVDVFSHMASLFERGGAVWASVRVISGMNERVVPSKPVGEGKGGVADLTCVWPFPPMLALDVLVQVTAQ